MAMAILMSVLILTTLLLWRTMTNMLVVEEDYHNDIVNAARDDDGHDDDVDSCDNDGGTSNYDGYGDVGGDDISMDTEGGEHYEDDAEDGDMNIMKVVKLMMMTTVDDDGRC